MIYVDADACPVKAEVERVGTRHKVQMFVVSNGGIRPSQNPLVETVVVPDGPDVADMWIADRAGAGDVVITGTPSGVGPLHSGQVLSLQLEDQLSVSTKVV